MLLLKKTEFLAAFLAIAVVPTTPAQAGSRRNMQGLRLDLEKEQTLEAGHLESPSSTASISTDEDSEAHILFQSELATTSASIEDIADDGVSLRNKVTAAIMVAVKYILATFNVREGRGSGEHDDGGDNPHSGISRKSMWERMKNVARKIISKARQSMGDMFRRMRNMLDDSATRGARMLQLAASFDVYDVPARRGRKRHDSGKLIKVDLARLRATPDVLVAVEEVCKQTMKMFPEVGYNQGFDAVCQMVFLALGANMGATLAVFTKWAVPVTWLIFNECAGEMVGAKSAAAYTWAVITRHSSPVFGWLSQDPIVGQESAEDMVASLLVHVFLEPLTTCCSRLGFSKKLQGEILEETLKAGVHGPAVTMYVVFCLLCVAEKQGAGDSAEVTMIKIPMQTAARRIGSFKALEKQCPVTLKDFVQGYRRDMADIPGADSRL